MQKPRLPFFLRSIFFGLYLFLASPALSQQASSDTISPNDLFSAGRINSAIIAWTQQILQGIDVNPSLYNRAQAYIVIRQFKLALADIDLLESRQRPYVDPRVLLLKGVVYSELGDYKSALRFLDISIKSSRTSPSFTNRAVIYQKLGDLPKAESDFKLAATIDPTYSTFYNLASIQLSLRKSSDCISSANEAISRASSSFYPGLTVRGMCLYYAKAYEPAIADLLRSASLNSYQPEVYLFLGLSLRELKRIPESQPYLLKSADLFLQQSRQADYQEVMKLLSAPP